MSSPFEETQKLTNLWGEFAARMASAGMNLDPTGDTPGPDAARQMRSAMLSAMSQYTQQYMRSEQFTDLMKKSLDASIAWQRQMNEFLTKAHHSVESAARSDVDELHRSVRHLEQRMLDQMEQIAARLDAVSQRLDAMQQSSAEKNGDRIESSGRTS
jgi:hypothetical protein